MQGMTRRAALIVIPLSQARRGHSAQSTVPVIVDTDAGTDDLLAIAFLLARPDVRIEAITVVNGLAHVAAGEHNLRRLLSLAGKSDVPVYRGQDRPRQGMRAFPDDWRRTSDALPGVRLPAPQGRRQTQPATEFLARRLSARSRPFSLLALGPLTNLAAAFEQTPALAGLEHLVIMGGALRVPGNLGDGGAFKTNNNTAEWNIFIDPFAASKVFRSRAKITLIPLDATAKVPIDLPFLEELHKRAHTPLGKFAGEVLESDRQHIAGGYFQAWDPLAAVALVRPGVVATKPMSIDVLQMPPQDGRTVEAKDRPSNVEVALDADAAEFKRVFLSAF